VLSSFVPKPMDEIERVLITTTKTSHDAITVLSPSSPDLPLFKQPMLAAKANQT
jgi:hypothetical protein